MKLLQTDKDIITSVIIDVHHREQHCMLTGRFAGFVANLSDISKTIDGWKFDVNYDYICLVNNNSLFMVRVKSVDVRSISVTYADHGKLSNVSYSLSNQSAIKELKEIFNKFKVKKHNILSNGLIDTTKYTKPPTYLIERMKINNKIVYKNTKKTSTSKSQTTTKKIYNIKKPNTTTFKRTTRYDVKTAITELNKKIKQLKAGKYKVELRIPNNDKQLAKADKKNLDEDLYDEFMEYEFMGFM